MSTYQETKLGKIANYKTGKLNSNAAKEDGEYPFFTCSRETFRTDTWSFDCECILLAGNNANAEYPIKYFPGGKFDAYQRTYVITPKDDKVVDIRYLYYVLELKLNLLKSISTGVTTKFLTMTILDNLEVILPDINTQKRIVSVLAPIENQIENNTRRIAILEEMARLIYREWFVHYRYPGHENDCLVDSGTELGDVPEGWETKTFGDLVDYLRESVQNKDVDENIPVLGLGDMPKKSICLSNWETTSDIGSTKLRFKQGDILFGKIRPYFHKVGFSQLDGVCSSDIFVWRAKEPKDFVLALLSASSDKFVETATNSSSGTKMPRAKWEVLEDYKVAYPTADLLEKLNSLIGSSLNQIRTLSIQNKRLQETRNLLLPKLISGKVQLIKN